MTTHLSARPLRHSPHNPGGSVRGGHGIPVQVGQDRLSPSPDLSAITRVCGRAAGRRFPVIRAGGMARLGSAPYRSAVAAGRVRGRAAVTCWRGRAPAAPPPPPPRRARGARHHHLSPWPRLAGPQPGKGPLRGPATATPDRSAGGFGVLRRARRRSQRDQRASHPATRRPALAEPRPGCRPPCQRAEPADLGGTIKLAPTEISPCRIGAPARPSRLRGRRRRFAPSRSRRKWSWRWWRGRSGS